jgi:hypothetical protein
MDDKHVQTEGKCVSVHPEPLYSALGMAAFVVGNQGPTLVWSSDIRVILEQSYGFNDFRKLLPEQVAPSV